ncbi:MAG: hypothetical protein AABX16_05090 [Nanoarchaeota archaeon]
MKKNKIGILYFLGVLFLIIAITAVINTIYIDGVSGTLWLCYAGLFIIGIGILLRKDYLIISQLVILAIPLLVWITDFLFYFFTGSQFLGITDYFFTDGNLLGKIISLQHLFTIPLALYALMRIPRTSFAAWKISIVQIFLFFLVSRLFSSPEKNINYVHRFAEYSFISAAWYPLFWFICFFAMIGVTNVVLRTLLSLSNKEIV